MDKENAQRSFDAIVGGLRKQRVFTVIDSKSHGYTAYFQICMVRENGGSYQFQALMNWLGFRAWKSNGIQEGNIDYTAGRYSFFIWDDIHRKAEDKGLEIPDDFSKLIKNVPCF